MKKLIVAALCMGSSVAFATGTAVCAAPTSSTSGSAITASANFVKVTFTPKCSTNVHLAYEQNNIAFAAAGGSSKGKTFFGGHSGGGGVVKAGDCAATGCTAANATGATPALLTAASST